VGNGTRTVRTLGFIFILIQEGNESEREKDCLYWVQTKWKKRDMGESGCRLFMAIILFVLFRVTGLFCDCYTYTYLLYTCVLFELVCSSWQRVCVSVGVQLAGHGKKKWLVH